MATSMDLPHWFYLPETGAGGGPQQQVALIFCDCLILKLGSGEPACDGGYVIIDTSCLANSVGAATLVCLTVIRYLGRFGHLEMSGKNSLSVL